jgi:hypothetical protein
VIRGENTSRTGCGGDLLGMVARTWLRQSLRFAERIEAVRRVGRPRLEEETEAEMQRTRTLGRKGTVGGSGAGKRNAIGMRIVDALLRRLMIKID